MKIRNTVWGAAALSAALAAGLARSAYERDCYEVEETVIASPKIRKPKCLVFLSDLHDKEFGEGNHRLLQTLYDIEPDAILIGGDTMVVHPGHASLAVTRRLLHGIRGLCPVYYGNGNHEQRMWRERDVYENLYRDFRRLLHREGVIYLSDCSALLDDDVRISGLNIDHKFYKDFITPHMSVHELRSHLGQADSGRYQILLAHSPLFFDAYAGWGADLTLSGHFHGGTIRLPFLGGVMTPQYQFFLPCCAGTFTKGDKRMMVSRGLGTHSINIRFLNKPQVMLINLIPEKNRNASSGLQNP